METLFFYGTLIDPDIALAVIGRPLKQLCAEPATLTGYKAMLVSGQPFPGLIADESAAASGIVIYGVRPDELARLIRYEERVMYGIETLSVRLDGSGALCEAQVFMPQRRVRLSEKPWDFEDWKRHKKRLYMARLLGVK